MAAKKIIKISVRSLVEFVLRSGDLTTAFVGSSRLVEGGKIHRKIQQAQGTEYQAEVNVAIDVERPGLLLQLSGRADGIVTVRDAAGDIQVTIDEIKSVTNELAAIAQTDNPQFWAQAKCYAYMYAVQQGLAAIHVQLSYCQADTLELKIFIQHFSTCELAGFVDDLIDQYVLWAEQVSNWQEMRNISACQVEFPFAAFRTGQRQLAVAVYKTLTMGRRLYAQAPTGTGKTMAAIFPAVKALGMGQIDRIFYLTAKTVTRQLAEEAFNQLRQLGLRCKTVTLTAKEKLCFVPEAACTPEECPYAIAYFDKINKVLSACWEREAFTREVIEQLAREYRLCPFELSLDLALWADAIICDYNYAFDPGVYLRRFFDENNEKNCLLIDEAHNLVDRAREMFSAEISKQEFLALKKNVKDRLPPVAKALSKINTFLLKSGKSCVEQGVAGQPDYCMREQPLADIVPLLRKFTSLAEEWLSKNEAADFREDLLEVYFHVHAFLRTADMYDERYITYLEKPDKDVKLKQFCVNPAYLLQQALTRVQAAVFISATLSPLDYFCEILGGELDDGKIAIASPFAQENLCLLIADTISTTYKTREYTYAAVVDSVSAAIGVKTGNYLVFLPSYRYLEEVYQRFCANNPLVATIRQTGDMSEAARCDFLQQYTAGSTETLVGFAVMGGIFGEGIDLLGERLLGAIVVGVGLPQVCLEREIIRQWFDKNARGGFDYAYTYPGMNKVLQAAGRVIRSESDRGIVLLIDDRFSQSRYKRLFPREWQGAIRVKTADDITGQAGKFWLARKGRQCRLEE